MQKSLVMTAGWVQFSICSRVGREGSRGASVPVKRGGENPRGRNTSPGLHSSCGEKDPCLDVRGKGDVDFLPVRGDAVEQQGVVHGAVPRRLKLVESPAERKQSR